MTTGDASVLASRLSAFPRLGLARLPTPLEPMRRLSAHLGGPRLWVKREDATGLGFGGNKLRKLGYVLHEAAAARLGMECHLAVHHGRVAPPAPEYATSGNALLNRLFGAHLHDVPWTGNRSAAIEALASRLREEGRRPYLVPYGASNPLGAVGYASAIVEIAEQSRALGVRPAAIVHCTGSGGTQAGLVVGASVAMPETRIVGIDIDAEPERVRSDVIAYARAAADLIGARFDESDLEVVAGHAGPAYGVPHAATIE